MPRRIVSAILLPAVLGCTTFGPVRPRDFITAQRPPQVWVWRADSSVMLVRGPHFLGTTDTLVGLVEGGYREIPLSDVLQVKANRPAPKLTAILVVGGIVAVVGDALLVKGIGSANDVAPGSNPYDGSVSIVHP